MENCLVSSWEISFQLHKIMFSELISQFSEVFGGFQRFSEVFRDFSEVFRDVSEVFRGPLSSRFPSQRFSVLFLLIMLPLELSPNHCELYASFQLAVRLRFRGALCDFKSRDFLGEVAPRESSR